MKVLLGGMCDRRQPEKKSGEDANGHREEKDAGVNRDFTGARNAGFTGGACQLQPAMGDQQSNGRPDERG